MLLADMVQTNSLQQLKQALEGLHVAEPRRTQPEEKLLKEMTIRLGEASLTALVEETVRRVGVDRLELVELIESEKEKLSPPAKELWEKLDVLLYLSPEEEVSPSPQERALMSQSANLPAHDQVTFNVLSDLRAGLYSSDYAERGGQSGESHRNMSVIRAAMFKDRDEGRQVNLYETPEEAIARLREGS